MNLKDIKGISTLSSAEAEAFTAKYGALPVKMGEGYIRRRLPCHSYYGMISLRGKLYGARNAQAFSDAIRFLDISGTFKAAVRARLNELGTSLSDEAFDAIDFEPYDVSMDPAEAARQIRATLKREERVSRAKGERA